MINVKKTCEVIVTPSEELQKTIAAELEVPDPDVDEAKAMLEKDCDAKPS